MVGRRTARVFTCGTPTPGGKIVPLDLSLKSELPHELELFDASIFSVERAARIARYEHAAPAKLVAIFAAALRAELPTLHPSILKRMAHTFSEYLAGKSLGVFSGADIQETAKLLYAAAARFAISPG